MKKYCYPAISILAFATALYLGIPHLLPKRLPISIEDSATPSQLEVIEKGRLSARLMNQATTEIVTEDKINELVGNSKHTIAIFPPDLIYRRRPKLPEDQKQKIAIAQRIALLENQVQSLQAELSLMKPASSWSWDWGFEKLWALVIWFFCTVATTMLKHATEAFLKEREKSPGKVP